MVRIVLGILVVLAGMGGCIAAPIVQAVSMLPAAAEIFPADEAPELVIEEEGSRTLYLVTRAMVDGRLVTDELEALPEGAYGFRDPQGRLVPLEKGFSSTLTVNGVEMESIGSARLEAGRWQVVVPAEPGHRYAVSEEGAAGMLGGLLAGLAILAVCVAAGVVLIVAGVRGMSVDRREEER